MNKLLLIFLTLTTYIASAQQVERVEQIILSKAFLEIEDRFMANKDAEDDKIIEIYEEGLKGLSCEYEKYAIINRLCMYYSMTAQYDKAIDLWNSASKEGMIFHLNLNSKIYAPYKDMARFQEFLDVNDRLIKEANAISKAEYFVHLPENYDPSRRYPLLFVLHGGVGDKNAIFRIWATEEIRNSFISVYPTGKHVHGSYARRFGKTGLEDVKEMYEQVKSLYSVDTTKIILAGQSLGGQLAVQLSYESIPAKGLLLAFPLKPKDFDYNKALELENKDQRVVMICGEQDHRFFRGQQEMSILLDSAHVEHNFIKYPDLGHAFPVDFSEQTNMGLHYLLQLK